MEYKKQEDSGVPPASEMATARIIDFVARTGGPAGDPMETPLLRSERRALRLLIAIGPERILAAVNALEHLKHACPTARRELSSDND